MTRYRVRWSLGWASVRECHPTDGRSFRASASAMPMLSQTTYVKTMIANTTLCALWTAIPIQALRYRFVG